jgi:hypothetical protein
MRRNLYKTEINLKNLSAIFMHVIEAIAEQPHLCNHSLPLFCYLFKSQKYSRKNRDF